MKDLFQTAYALRHPGQHSVHRPRTVLVLGGGGMRGMAHVGVLRAIRTLGIEIDAIVGTSIGALVGAMYAGGYPLEKIESLVTAVQKEVYFRLIFV
jgi:predicted acylesterase/phospholipase RssA